MNRTIVQPAVRQILLNRGIVSEEEIEEYMSPLPRKTYDPFLMKGMEEASDMIIKYAAEKRKICVYGDYDADGITSVSLMMTLLRELEADAWYYIPSRFEEGYGLNMKAADVIAESGAELVITVDNGSVAFDEIEYIKSKGIEVIVTDHHNVEAGRVPDCIMLNPKQPGDNYPFKFLCGCGIAFKLAQAVSRKTGISKKTLNSLLDIVGIATVGDIVPLKDENRTLVKYGMDRIKRNERPGMRRLLDEISIKPHEITSYGIAFGIVPHINSCGRMKTADIGVELLTSSDEGRLGALAAELAALNTERRRIQEDIFEKAVDYIDSCGGPSEFIVYSAGEAHEGVTGIVAGKLKEKYYRPVLVLSDSSDGRVKGTGRSIKGVDLHAVLSRYSHLFERFGGHAGACGLTMKKEFTERLSEGLQEDIRNLLSEDSSLLDYEIETDCEISSEAVTVELARDIKSMEPFGEGNSRPVFLVSDVYIRSIRKMGAKGQYRKLLCSSPSGRTFDAVMFDSDAEGFNDAQAGIYADITCEIDENIWNGRSTVQLIVKKLAAVPSVY